MSGEVLEIYTDGSCLGNPGPGGWGVLIVRDDKILTEISGSEANSTNNRMELFAVIKGLEIVSGSPKVIIHTDSMYVKNGISSWILNWKKNGWKTASGKPVKNIDLWVTLDDLALKHEVKWKWVKAHNGNYYNEKVDKLARLCSLKVKS